MPWKASIVKRDGTCVLHQPDITVKQLKRASRHILDVTWVLVRYEVAIAFMLI
jgi:hypothetical protein